MTDESCIRVLEELEGNLRFVQERAAVQRGIDAIKKLEKLRIWINSNDNESNKRNQ